jgi:hypothetical protein
VGFPGAAARATPEAAATTAVPATYDVATPPSLPVAVGAGVPPHWAPPPVPVQALTYGTPVANRPGIITAIGIISIIVGSLAILFNAVTGLQAIGMMMMSQFSGAATTVTTPAPGGGTVSVTNVGATAGDGEESADDEPEDPNAMPEADREIVLAGIDQVRRLAPERRRQLDALLAKGGRQMFFFTGPQLTPEAVRRNVTDHGRLPSAGGGDNGPDFFVIGQGRFELNDGHAVFFPDGGGEAVRVDASDTELVGWEQGLTDEQADAVVAEVQKKLSASASATGGSATPLTPAQVATIKQQFQAPGQGFIRPMPTIADATAQVAGVYASPVDKSVSVTTLQGSLNVDATGAVTSSNTWGGGAFGGVGGPVFQINGTAAAMAVAGTLLGGALGVYLLIIGILVLRQSLRGRRLHLIYALLKIPVAVLAGVGLAWMWSSFIVNVATTTGGVTPPAGVTSGMTAAAMWWAALLVLLGCAYPIFLLVALRTPTVREYYATVKPE